MGKVKKYLKKSANGRFFLCIDKPDYSIDPEKRTQLWLSSDYLLEESIKENPKNSLLVLDFLIEWNKNENKFEECQKLLEIKNKIKL